MEEVLSSFFFFTGREYFRFAERSFLQTERRCGAGSSSPVFFFNHRPTHIWHLSGYSIFHPTAAADDDDDGEMEKVTKSATRRLAKTRH